jgi:NADPH:quinone reductase-like Zn-dependent oxidoreductase
MGGESKAEIDVGALLSKRQQIIGSTLRARPASEKAEIVASFVERFGEDLRAGRIRPVIDEVLPLERVADAHRRMADDHFGKLVLRVTS